MGGFRRFVTCQARYIFNFASQCADVISMRRIRVVVGLAGALLCVSACSSSASDAVDARLQNDLVSSTAIAVEADSGTPTAIAETSSDVGDSQATAIVDSADDSTVTEEEGIAAELLDLMDDVAVRLVEVEPVDAGGSGRFVVEVFGVMGRGIGGDGFVQRPSLSVQAGMEVTFANVPSSCTSVGGGLECSDEEALFNSGVVATETDALLLGFEFLVPDGAELPVVFDVTASSFENPVSNDPNPSNNVLTVEVPASS